MNTLNTSDMNITADIEGSGGKGGGSTFTEQNNTLRSNARVKVINVISEGEIEGIAGGARGLYFNNTNLENSDGVRNIPKVEWDWRPGLPTQTPMSGFPGAVSVVTVNTVVTNAAPVVRSVTASSIDAVRVVLTFTSGLMEQDTSSGSLKQTTVQYALDRRAAGGSWLQVGSNIELTEKVNSPFQKTYLIDRPNGSSGLWDYRVRRISADNVTSNIKNDFQLSNVAEIQNKSQAYENTAVVGLSLLAESFGGQIPKVGFLVKGLLLDIPSNYNPVTRVYTGIWNGLFVKSSVAIDNPAWVLYNLITNTRWGAGEIIGSNGVDPYSFYAAAVYCDELVPNGSGGTERRFTFNFPVSSRDVGLRLVNSIAGMMRGRLISVGGLWTVVQDRPASVSHAFNNTNVLDGMFSYSSTTLADRHTAFNVTYQDKSDLYAAKILTIDSSTINAYASTYASALAAAESKYGYELAEIVSYGATTEGQAIRTGLWALDTELNQTELVSFKTGTRIGASLLPNQIIEIYDEDYVRQAGAGRVLSATGTSVTLDRPVTLVAGSKIKVLLADGITLEVRDIVQTTGTLSTITVSAAFSQAIHEDGVFTVTHAYSARQFRILSIKQDGEDEVSVEGVFHDPNKYARIETNVNVPTAAFASVVASRTGPVGTLSFTRSDVQNAAEGLNGIRRSLNVSWAPPSLGQAVKYVGQWKHETGNWVEFETRVQNFTIDPAYPGSYTITVAAVSSSKIVGPFVTGTHVIDVNGSSLSSLNAPTNLTVVGGGTSFSGLDVNFVWTNPASNISTLGTLRDFEVKFVETAGGTTVRTVYVDPVPAGATQTLMYTYSMNAADGGPRRSIQVQVRCRDSKNNLTNGISATFTNPAPSVPSNITVLGALGSNKITYDLPSDPDYKGVLIWRSTTSGFTPSAANLVYDGSDAYIADNALTAGTTYYYLIAAYDAFAKSFSGTSMNISAQYSGTTVSNGGIASGATNPGTGVKGDLFFNSTDNKLYRYTGTAWTAAVPSTDISGTIADAQLAAIAAAKVTGTLVDSQIAAVSAAKVTGQLSNAQLAAIDATKLTGQITSTQITDTSISTPKLAAGAVTTAKIQAGAVTANEVAANAITATKIQAGAITTEKLLVTSKGQALNDDPAFEDSTAWVLVGSGLTFGSGTTALNAVGNKFLSNSAGGSNGMAYSRELVVDPTKTYLLTANLFAASGNDRNMYIFVDMYDSAGAQVTGTTTGWGGSLSGYVFGGLTPQNQFTRQGGQFGAGTPRPIPANVRTIKVGVWFQYSSGGTTSVLQMAQDLRLERVNDGNLVVDGSITALKIAANTIEAGNIKAATITGSLLAVGTVTATNIQAETITGFHIVANSVSGDKIVANSITAGKIAASTITGDKIAGTTITGANIVGNTITGDKVAAGTITATQIDSRNLTIKDSAGNVIFSAGVPITASYADAALKNSSIAVSGGAISGIGTGNGTVVANSSIAVSGGAISGIGTGNGTAVANNQITISSNGTLSGAGGGQVTIGGLGFNGDLNASSDLVLVGAVNVSINGNKITKTGASGGWDGGAYSRDGYTGGAYASCVFGTTGAAMMGLNTDPATDASYTSIDHALYWTGDGRIQIYRNGGYFAEVIGPGGSSTSDVFSVVYDGRSMFYLRNGSVIHQYGVTVNGPLFFDCSIASQTAFLANCRFGPISTNKDTNLLDSRTWVIGSTGGQPGFGANGVSAGGSNYIEYGLLPNGENGIVWTAKSGTSAGGSPEGGWDGSPVPIDNSKMYRFSVWVRLEGNLSGSVYLGPSGSSVNDLNGPVNTNPYFVATGRNTIPNSKWLLFVGFVYPASYTGTTNTGGIYRGDTGAFVAGAPSFRWTSTTYTTWMRAYQYYTNTPSADAYTVFWNPRIDVCDGTEPSVSSMLAMGSTSARNPITTGTASTYIASAAINLAQINTASIGSLSAITATIGTLRTAASGARTEIADNVIRVYDSSNVLRVKIGNLA